jgi:hypothetical protein
MATPAKVVGKKKTTEELCKELEAQEAQERLEAEQRIKNAKTRRISAATRAVTVAQTTFDAAKTALDVAQKVHDQAKLNLEKAQTEEQVAKQDASIPGNNGTAEATTPTDNPQPQVAKKGFLAEVFGLKK